MSRVIGSLVMALCICSASPARAEEVLNCADIAVIGFRYGPEGWASSVKFDTERFTIKVVSDTQRLIKWMAGGSGTVGVATLYECKPPPHEPERLVCRDLTWGGYQPWAFYRNDQGETYTRAFLYSAAGQIHIAHGTCAKF